VVPKDAAIATSGKDFESPITRQRYKANSMPPLKFWFTLCPVCVSTNACGAAEDPELREEVKAGGLLDEF
jgi:hypothetical protein